LTHGKTLNLSVSATSSIAAFDKALESGRVPASGKVTDRLVRSTFAAIERGLGEIDVDTVPNPLPKPHNLAWYFNRCTCPTEVRQFAVALHRFHLRVWSVAQTADGWNVLVQVFGAPDKTAGAVQAVDLEARMPLKRLQHFALREIHPYKLDAQNVELFMHQCAKGLLEQEGLGDFVEVELVRRGL